MENRVLSRLFIWKGRLGLDLRVGEGVNPLPFCNLCKIGVFWGQPDVKFTRQTNTVDKWWLVNNKVLGILIIP